MIKQAYQVAAFCAAIAAFAPAAYGQDQLPAQESHRDWSVFVDGKGSGKYCYAATPPRQTDAFRSGKPVDKITRGDTFLLIATYPGDKVKNEVSIRLGFPADAGQAITLSVGQQNFELFTSGEVAWLATPEKDKDVIAAMKKGSKAIVTATSKRGTKVVDEYSLIGFSASITAVAAACK
ncbi:MAG: invasion associated locus B family protein [Neomegalonema sp.]|nr:invasion associated locus B family protein [Neomegalonema sp.]